MIVFNRGILRHRREAGMFSISEIIDLAIQIETNGEDTYRKGASQTRDPSIASLLRWLADQEKEHIEWFRNLKSRVDAGPVTAQLDDAAHEILRSVLGDQTFSLADAEVSKQDNVIELLKVSLEFEKDTIVFYEMIMEFVEDEGTKGHLGAIVLEEENHVKALRDYLDGTERMVRIDENGGI